jgi:hypothetical protein
LKYPKNMRIDRVSTALFWGISPWLTLRSRDFEQALRPLC